MKLQRNFIVAGALAACVASLSCGPGSGPRTPTDANGNSFPVEITHEPCDIKSKSSEKTDANQDGKFDLISVRSGKLETCRAVDLNFDGRFDHFLYFNAAGQVVRKESHWDPDDVLDEVALYANGVVVAKHRETNLDGKFDTWDLFSEGKISKRHRDTNGDGLVDQWWIFPDSSRLDCAKVATDDDGDGKPDQEFDTCGSTADEPQPSPPAVDASAPVAAADAGAPDAVSEPAHDNKSSVEAGVKDAP